MPARASLLHSPKARRLYPRPALRLRVTTASPTPHSPVLPPVSIHCRSILKPSTTRGAGLPREDGTYTLPHADTGAMTNASPNKTAPARPALGLSFSPNPLTACPRRCVHLASFPSHFGWYHTNHASDIRCQRIQLLRTLRRYHWTARRMQASNAASPLIPFYAWALCYAPLIRLPGLRLGRRSREREAAETGCAWRDGWPPGVRSPRAVYNRI